MNGIVVIVLSSVFLMGTVVILVRNANRILQRSIGGFVAFGLACLFGAFGIGALAIGMLDPMANPTAQWYALGACVAVLLMGFSGALLVIRKS